MYRWIVYGHLSCQHVPIHEAEAVSLINQLSYNMLRNPAAAPTHYTQMAFLHS
jgi:hypothetical protein